MKPKTPFNYLMLILLTAGFLHQANVTKSQTARKHNVLLISVDDMNDHIGFLGNSNVPAPNLKRLAARGMVFLRAYAQFPLCNPSRTSLLTGWRPNKTGIVSNGVRPRSVLGSNVVFLPEYFRQYGYRTERYGKIMHSTFENDVKWDYAEPGETPSEQETGIAFSEETAGGSWWINDVSDQSTPDGIAARNLVAPMKKPQTQPFFYALGLHTHNPFTPSLKYWNMSGNASVQELLPVNKQGNTTNLRGNSSTPITLPATPPNDRADVPSVAFPAPIHKTDYEWKRTIHAYMGEVSQMDAQLGLVLDELDRQNLWATTIVIFYSDHGQHLGEHEGTWLKNTLFEESLHAPLIVCVPGKRAGKCSRLVELVDLFPTLAQLCGLPTPKGKDGSSFARLLDNPTLQWKRAVFSQVARSGGRSVQTQQYRYNSWGQAGEELYDHNTDPYEYTNLVGKKAYAAVLNQMRAILPEGWTKSLPPSQSTIEVSDLNNSKIGLDDVAVSSAQPSLYPNPSKGVITVKYNCVNEGRLRLLVHDIKGNLLFDKNDLAIKGSNTYRLNLLNLKSGLYYLDLVIGTKQNRVKFIINK